MDEFYHLWEHGGTLASQVQVEAATVGAVGLVAVLIMAVFSGGSIFTLIWEAFLRRKADANPNRPSSIMHHRSGLCCRLCC